MSVELRWPACGRLSMWLDSIVFIVLPGLFTGPYRATRERVGDPAHRTPRVRDAWC